MELLISLAVGLVLEVVIFMALRQFAKFGAKQAAVVVALLAVAFYVPYAILDWPGGDEFSMHLAVYLVAAYAMGLILANREARIAQHGGDERWFHWGPAGIVIFFVVLVLFDGVLVVVASRGLPQPLVDVFLPKSSVETEITSAFPGVVAHDYQKRQTHFNRFLEQIEKQKVRGWRVNKGWVGAAHVNQPSTFQVTVVQANAEPLRDAHVTGTFMRPSDTRLDQPVELTETAPGIYRADVVLPVHGVWDLELEVRKGDDLHYLRASTTVQE